MSLIEIQRYLGDVGLSVDAQIKIVKSILVIVVFLMIRIAVDRLIANQVKSKHLMYRWRKITLYTFYVCWFVIVGGIWFEGIQSVATYFGLLSAGLAVAFKDYLSNLAGWLYIFWKEPFNVGQRVQIGKVVGDIVDIGPVHLSLLEIGNFTNAEQYTGRIVFLPNSHVFTKSIANYDISFPYLWHEIDVVVTFESDWEKAKKIIDERVKTNSLVYDEVSLKKFRSQSKQFLLPDMVLDPIIFTSVADQGVRLSARFVCEPRNRRTIEQKVWEDVLRDFSKEDTIDFAYPTHRYYDNRSEGKPGAGGAPRPSTV